MVIRTLAVTGAVALAVLVGAPANADQAPIPLLTGSDLRIDGPLAGERLGASVATGDVNGDGITDMLFGAPQADRNSRADSGSVYVVFGTTQAGPVDLANLGSGGFRIDGASPNASFTEGLATADFNGDGKDDIIIGAPSVGSGGTAYVVYGRTATSTIDLDDLGAAGVRIDAAASGDSLGADVADVADLNSDGKADIAIGANQADSGGANSGTTYVILGRSSNATINVGSLGIGGFTIKGAAAQEISGDAVANAGDVNADGRDDLVIGAFAAGANSRSQSGSAFVVFGQAVPGDVDLASLGSKGFRIDGAAAGDFLGFSVAGIGDINADGRDDMALGAPSADFGGTSTGSTYVILGRTSPSDLDLASLGSEGFRIDGAATTDSSGVSVTGDADVNDDGVADLLICAHQAKNSFNLAGATYVVFGGSNVSNRQLVNIGQFGVRLDGGSLGERSCSGRRSRRRQCRRGHRHPDWGTERRLQLAHRFRQGLRRARRVEAATPDSHHAHAAAGSPGAGQRDVDGQGPGGGQQGAARRQSDSGQTGDRRTWAEQDHLREGCTQAGPEGHRGEDQEGSRLSQGAHRRSCAGQHQGNDPRHWRRLDPGDVQPHVEGAVGNCPLQG